jgi:hypothetical protein
MGADSMHLTVTWYHFQIVKLKTVARILIYNVRRDSVGFSSENSGCPKWEKSRRVALNYIDPESSPKQHREREKP